MTIDLCVTIGLYVYTTAVSWRVHVQSILWVDALCIVQNSSQDLAEEASQMGSIYANSLLTSAAPDVTDCNDGFLVDRYPLQIEGCPITDDSENDVLFAGTFHKYLSHYHDRETSWYSGLSLPRARNVTKDGTLSWK
jgi:hypothetical protein